MLHVQAGGKSESQRSRLDVPLALQRPGSPPPNRTKTQPKVMSKCSTLLEPELIAALYVETNGCDFGFPDIDPWDILRDANFYLGPFPVVAHPPCERWGRFSEGSMTKKDRVTGDDGGCFTSALASLRRWGGVLEHPARKKTWLLYVGPKPPELIWGPCEQRLPAKRLAERGYESARRCGVIANMSSRQRQRTPLRFLELLLELANRCQPAAFADVQKHDPRRTHEQTSDRPAC